MKKPLRTIGLLMLIGFDIAFISIMFAFGMVWGWVAVCITALIIGFEVYGVTIGWKQKDGTRLKKTISQLYWAFGAEHKTWATIGVVSFGLSMLGLCIHLLDFNKKD